MTTRTVPLDLGTGSSPGRDGQEGRARHINCMLEVLGGEARAPKAIYPLAGLTRVDRGGVGGVARGFIDRSETEFIGVRGQTVTLFDTSMNETTIGALAGVRRVFMARNQISTPQIGIVTDGLYYVLQGSTITQIVNPNLPAPNSIDFIDGRMVFGIDDGRFYLSDTNDATAIRADALATAEASADGLRRVVSHNGFLHLMGTRTLEIWRNAGLPGNQPFEPVQRDLEFGCLAAHSVAKADNGLFWVDHHGRVVVARNSTPQRISTHSVERAIQSLTPAQQRDLWAFTSWYQGHEFYTLVADTFTWEYDGTTQVWHERQSYGLSRFRGNAHIFFNGQHLIGDYASGKIYRLNPDADDEDGDPLVAEVWCPPLSEFPGGMTIHELAVGLISGAGLNNASLDKRFPKIMMDYSEDGGRTWSTERQGDVGVIGEYDTFVRWKRLGTTRRKPRTFRLRMSAAVRRGFFEATLKGRAVR